MGLTSENTADAELQRDLTELLLEQSYGFVRDMTQLLQGLTGLLLTSYLTVLTAIAQLKGHLHVEPVLAALPAGLFTASLALLFLRVVLYQGGSFQFGDLKAAVEAYENALSQRRRQLVIAALSRHV
jgi:hypothetical protein